MLLILKHTIIIQELDNLIINYKKKDLNFL